MTNGPFANLTIPWGHSQGFTPSPDPLGYHPHCFQPDINCDIAGRYLNQSAVDHLIYGAASIAEFQD